MDSPRISIIVPIYNVESYLRECLDSIKAQTFTDWECILVDDGSTDSSPSICDEYSSMDSRYITIHKENGGVSSARNAGIRAAKGEFIGFVDSDDWIEPEMYQTLLTLITEYDADIAQVSYIKEFKGRKSITHLVKSRKTITGKEALREANFNRLPNFLCNKLHRRRIINCEFPEGRVFEDVYIYGHWLKQTEKMVIDPAPMYHYRMRKGSIVHSNSVKNREDYFLSCIDSVGMLEDVPENSRTYYEKNAFINKAAIHAAKIIARREKDTSRRNKTIQMISTEVRRFPIPPIRYMGIKKWWRARLLQNHPGIFASLMRGVRIMDLDAKDKERRYYD